MRFLKSFTKWNLKPIAITSLWGNILFAIPRILCGLLLTLDFGSSKFGMPWSNSEEPLALFEVASWFPEDVAKFGIPFSLAPWLFAWLGAASEAIGGLFLALGLATRFWGLMIGLTMLTAIFFQQWPKVLEQGVWPILPALGFLWVSIYALVFGSGKIGLDHLISRKIT
ncbi:DoxX family protein [Sediminicola sp. YIK13]|uniref:DoxX family protein n=1 Tax=Sediminicola sp. YIK13 TaxID=1453352 RepID=UPI000720E621|nr:DoxX family protein [Sediminicola sp. YIK13]ALM06598.1 DoxX family protein [Sediminicola sp. YIK13]